MTPSGSPSLHAILEKSPSEDDSISSEGESYNSPFPKVCNTVMFAIPIATTPPPEETSTFQIASMWQQQTTTPTPLLEQLVAHQEEQ
jgi:hypothetical protein